MSARSTGLACVVHPGSMPADSRCGAWCDVAMARKVVAMEAKLLAVFDKARAYAKRVCA